MMTYYRKMKDNYSSSAYVGIVLTFLLISVFVLSGLFSQPVMAAQTENTKNYVIDSADILSDSEEARINAQCQKTSVDCETDIVIITLSEGLDYGILDNYVKEILTTQYGYHGTGSDCDAIAYVVDMVSRADRIIALGTAKATITDGELDSIREDSEKDLTDGDYAYSFRKFVRNVETHLNQHLSYKLMWALPFKLLVSLVVSVVAVLCMMYHAKSRMTVGSTTYMKDHNFQIRAQRDDFINTTVVTRQIPKNNSSGGGGGGGHSGSSGGHF